MNTNQSASSPTRQPRYDNEEFATRGGRLYDEKVRPQLDEGSHGKYVAIDIESGLWEIDENPLTACERLIRQKPYSQTWLVRVGHPYLHRIGGPRRHLEQQ